MSAATSVAEGLPVGSGGCLEEKGDSEWATAASEACKYCGREDYQPGAGPRTLLVCSCCQGGAAHIECEEAATGAPPGDGDWFCCQVRARPLASAQELTSGLRNRG